MKKQHSLIQVVPVVTMFVMLLLIQAAVAENEPDNDFWISPSTNTSNLGTLDNPFDGSTSTKFDTVMGSLPPNCTIHILAGTYYTDGSYGWTIKDGQRLLGSGIDVTTLKLVANAPDTDDVLADASVHGANLTDTNIEIADLTCDCNYQGGDCLLGGVLLGGTNHMVERVKVIHLAGFSGETFGIGIQSGYGNIIENCEVSQYAGGNQVSAIVISTGSGVMCNNRVLLGSPRHQAHIAFNASGDNGLLIQGNYVDGADVGVYNDTFGSTNIIVTDNIIKNVYQGICYNNNGNIRQNLIISHNTIMLTTNAPLGSGYSKTAIAIGSDSTNINIIENIAGWDGTPNPGEIGYDYFLTLVEPGDQGIVVANNRADSLLNSSSDNIGISSNGYVSYNNYDFYGNLLGNLNQNNFHTRWLPTAKIDGTKASYFSLLPGWAGNVGGTWWGNAANPAIMNGQVKNLVFAVNVLTTNAGTFTFRLQLSGADNANQFLPPTFSTNFVSAAGTNINTLFYGYGWANATNPWTALAASVWMDNNMNNTNVKITGGSFTAN